MGSSPQRMTHSGPEPERGHHFTECPPILLERLERIVAALDSIDSATSNARHGGSEKHDLRNAIETAMVLLQSTDDYLHGVANLAKDSCLQDVNRYSPANRVIRDLANLHKHGHLNRDCRYFREAPRHDEVAYSLSQGKGPRPILSIRGRQVDVASLLVESFASQIWFIGHHYSVGPQRIQSLVGRRWKGSLWRPMVWHYVTIFEAAARRGVPYPKEIDALMDLVAAGYIQMNYPGAEGAIVYEFGTSFALHPLQHRCVRDELTIQGTGSETRFLPISAECPDEECITIRSQPAKKKPGR